MERNFYKSLSQLAEHYDIEPLQTQDYGYPYNIALAMWDAETKLKKNNVNWDTLRLVQDSKKTFFTSEERYSALCHSFKCSMTQSVKRRLNCLSRFAVICTILPIYRITDKKTAIYIGCTK